MIKWQKLGSIIGLAGLLLTAAPAFAAEHEHPTFSCEQVGNVINCGCASYYAEAENSTSHLQILRSNTQPTWHEDEPNYYWEGSGETVIFSVDHPVKDQVYPMDEQTLSADKWYYCSFYTTGDTQFREDSSGYVKGTYNAPPPPPAMTPDSLVGSGGLRGAIDDLAAGFAPVLVKLILAAVGLYGLFLGVSWLKRLIPAKNKD